MFKPPFEHECSSLVEILRQRTLQQPDTLLYTFLLDGETEEISFTYQQLDRRARAIAASLQAVSASGERALLLYQPNLEYIAAFFGCLYAGVIAVPVYTPRLSRHLFRLESIIQNAQATLALTTTGTLSFVERQFDSASGLGALRWLTTDNIDDALASEWQSPSLGSSTLAFLQYTSGSTGKPKGVALTHGNLLHNCEYVKRCFEHTPQAYGIIWTPPYHDMGLIGGILQPLYSGFPMTLMSPFSFLQRPVRWLQAITRYRGTTSGGPNFAYELCAQKITPEQKESLDLSSWDVAFCGAEPTRADTLERFATAFEPCGFRREAFYSCYGLAEATLIVSGGKKAAPPVIARVDASALAHNRVIKEDAPVGSSEGVHTLVGCGQTLLDQQIKIVNPQTLKECRHDEVGEIWVMGASVARGYWNSPEENEHTFGAYLADTGEGPFLRTGDLGFMDDGELFVAGRLKDLIIIGGRNLHPQDIELTVEQSHASLRHGCGAAFGIEHDVEEKLVVVHEVERHFRDVDIKDVSFSIRRAVVEEHQAQVHSIVLIKHGSIPKTSSGKIQRHACRAAFLSGTLDVLGGINLQANSVYGAAERQSIAGRELINS
ncbi:MAG TPA: fatty acyl-AMP ligase [Pyrinomonadaceae bacterium]|jgi:acyl-CoA synthetase (AMP-forming)/AMP-acid ligase II